MIFKQVALLIFSTFIFFMGLIFQNPQPAYAQTVLESEPISVLFWNLESSGNDPSVIANQIIDLVDDKGTFDLVGLSEVREINSNLYIQSLGTNFAGIVSESGGADRMVIGVNLDRFDILRTSELIEFDNIALNFFANGGNLRFRSPFFAILRDKESSENLLFMVNHLARNDGGDGNGGFREQQAQGLVAWADAQSLPIIMGGDLNLDYNFVNEEGNLAFSIIFGDDDSDDLEYRWIRPVPLVDTNHSGNGNQDTFPNSILDFVTVANFPADWSVSESEVIVRPGDFPDNSRTSDHRPVFAVFQVD